MSGGASAAGPRRGPPGLEEATSKKKQKDRANQESKDGDPRRGRSGTSRFSWLLLPLYLDVQHRGLFLPSLSWLDAEKKTHCKLDEALALNLRSLAKIQTVGSWNLAPHYFLFFLLLPVSTPRKEQTKEGE